MSERFLFQKMRDVVQSRKVDAGGMFAWNVGVVREGDRYRAFVETGWGGGGLGPSKDDKAAALADIERLLRKLS